MSEYFTKSEIVCILNAAATEADLRHEAGVQDDAEHIGWQTALIHLATSFGVIREYVDNTPPAEAREQGHVRS